MSVLKANVRWHTQPLMAFILADVSSVLGKLMNIRAYHFSAVGQMSSSACTQTLQHNAVNKYHN